MQILNVIETAHPEYPSRLHDSRDIARYIDSVSVGYVDEELIEELYLGYSANLVQLSIEKLKPGNADGNKPSASKQKRYSKMGTEYPPLVVDEDLVVQDGNHRLRDALQKGVTKMWCYVLG